MANQSSKSPFGVGHDGRPKGVPAAPGMHGPARGADAFKGHHVPGNIARDGAPKAHHDVPVAAGQHTRSRATGLFHQGGDALSRADANPANPLGGAPRGKTLTAPQSVPGQRSRVGEQHAAPGVNHARGQANKPDLKNLGAAVLAEALCNK